MGPLVAEHLSADPLSVRSARHLVDDVVGDLLPVAEREELLLCASEVVTNAIEHGAEPIELLVAASDDRIRVEVRDSSPLRPRLGDPSPSETRGRGLQIVDRCADRWGVDSQGETGKSVWFEFNANQV